MTLGPSIRIQSLFDRLVLARLTVNLAKCEFAKATAVYLGKVVVQDVVRPVHATIEAIEKYQPPTTKKEIMSFIDMVGYYRSFCKNLSSVVAQLTDLLKARVRYVWMARCQTAFENVKALLCSAPVLTAPWLSDPFRLRTCRC